MKHLKHISLQTPSKVKLGVSDHKLSENLLKTVQSQTPTILSIEAIVDESVVPGYRVD